MTEFMTDLFRTVLNMSVTAAVVIAVLSLVRLPLKKAPKVITSALWFVALFRLLCPVSFESAVSLFSLRAAPRMEYIQSVAAVPDIQPNQFEPTQNAVTAAPTVIGSVTSAPAAAPSLTLMNVLGLIWAAVAVGLILYGAVSYILLKRRIGTATRVDGRIFESDRIDSPFVCGLVRPRIYLPALLKDMERAYITEHENTHIRRCDYIVKPLWFLAVCLHWFNPLVWLAFRLMVRDMEMSCDEAVLRKMGDGVKADYSSSLLAFSSPRALFSASPLAFGESNIFSRIKNVLSFKRPVVWVVIVAVAAAVTLTVTLAANPKTSAVQKSLAAQYLGFKTPYVGDNSKVGGILSLLEYPDGVGYRSFELQTSEEPYGVTIVLGFDDAETAKSQEVETVPMFKRNAAIVFALVDNAGTVTFRIDDSGTLHELSYSRVEIDALYGSDVRTLSQSEETFKVLLVTQVGEDTADTPAASSANSGQFSSVDYIIYKLGKNGVVLAYKCPLTEDQKKLAQDTIANAMLKSAAWPAVDVDSLDEYYLIRSNTADAPSANYYAFMHEGRACLQRGKNGMYSFIDDTLYASLKTLLDLESYKVSAEIETKLAAIMSSPKTSSNPNDYIEAHRAEYEAILKLGQPALSYMLTCFSKGEGDTLKGWIMMALCMDIMGTKGDPYGYIMTPTEWYAQCTMRPEDELSDYVYSGSDTITKLVYETETAKHQGWDGGFTVVAVHEFGRYEEGDKLKVIVTTFAQSYHLYGESLQTYTGSSIPAALTYTKNADGTYTLSEYTQAQDGSLFAPSIRAFCTMPVSGTAIPGLADEILKHYSNYSDIIELQKQNLEELLKQHGITEYTLVK